MSAEAKRPSTVSKKRHRFQRVGERVANLQTELQLHVKTNATEISLSFKEELGLQGELTTIESFQVLYRKLQPLCTTTPQLLHHLKKIVKLLTSELQAEPVADIQRDRMLPLLKLITALARELRREFYPHFAGMLPHMIAIIDTKDPELSTQVFKTLTMLFNVLRVQLLKDMDAVHKCYFPLLGHPKPFVREFAAQTLSVLLRRIDDAKDLRKYLTTYLKALACGSGKDNLILRDGSAKLFFALLKNVGHGFHSRMNEIFVALLGSFRPKHVDEEGDEDRELVCDIVSRTSDYMVKHTDEANAHEMLECFALVLEKMLTKGDRHAANDLYISRVATMLLGLVRYKSARLISPSETSVQLLHGICASLLKPTWILTETAEVLCGVVLRLLETVWRLVPADKGTTASQVERFYAVTVDSNQQVALYWRREVLAMVERALLHAHVTVDFVRDFVFPHAMKLAMKTLLESEDRAAFAVLVGRLGAYATKHESVADDNDNIVIRDGLRLFTLSSTGDKTQMVRVLEVAEDVVKGALEDFEDVSKLILAWKMTRAVALIDVPNKDRLAFAAPLLAQVEKFGADNNAAVEWSLLRAELWRVQQIALSGAALLTSSVSKKNIKSVNKTSEPVKAWSALDGHEQSFAMLSAFLEYLKMQTREKQREMLRTGLLEDAEQRLGANLRSPTRAIRLVTLEILACIDRLEFLPTEDVDAAILEGECDLLDHSLGAESLTAHVSVDVEREIVRHITRVKILSRSKQTPTVYKKLAVHHLFGLYHVKFATLWSHVADAIAEVVSLDFPSFWPSVRDEMWFAATRTELPLPSTDVERQQAKSIQNLEKNPTAVAEREFQVVCRLERGELDTTAVTDTLTHHSLLWKGMEKFVDAIETKTKFFVPVFLLFLRDQYSVIYKDEIDEPKQLAIHETLEKAQQLEVGEWISKKYQPSTDVVTSKAVRIRTLDYLRLFAAFKNMKGAFANAVLHDLFFDLFLMKADDAVSKLALQCMYGFGKKHLGAYKTQLNRIADAATFREELTTFHIAPDAGVVLNEHRAALLPVLVRLLYAKAVSKKGRNAGDTVGARRAAILSYLAALPPHELIFFIELVVRAFSVDIFNKVPTTVEAVPDVEMVQQSRVLGFLNLLEDLIGQLGVHLTSFVPVLADVVLAVLTHNYRERDEELAKKHEEEVDDAENAEDVDMEDEETHVHSQSKSAGMRKQIRTLAFRRLAELVEKYDDRLDFTPWVSRILNVVDDAIMHLPGAVVGAGKASALLQFVVSVAGGDRARKMLSGQQVASIVRTLSSGLSNGTDASARGIHPEILGSVLQFLSAMLDGDEKEDATQDSWQLVPHIPFVLEHFVIRFQSKAARYALEKYAGSSKRELVFLCRLSQHLSATPELQQSAQKSAFDLFQLLLPFLQRNHRSSATDMENILQVLTQLVPLLADPKRYLASLAKHLAPGPNGLTDRAVRTRLVDVFVAIGDHPNGAGAARVGEFLRHANAFDAKKIEEIDFETRMGALSDVNNQDFADFVDEAALLTPIAAQFLQCMHETEYTVRSSALAGITTLVRLSAEAVDGKLDTDVGVQRRVVLLNVLESLIMPSVRVSVRVPSEDIRRGFVMLLGSLADYAEQFKAMAYVPSDLAFLRRADDVEVDFFYNLTHIQVHRKRRALQRLSSLMKEMAETKSKSEQADVIAKEDVVMTEPALDEDEDEAMDGESTVEVATKTDKWFSNSTVNNLLLPLVMHFIYEAQAKSQESLRHEAAICIGASAGLLGWSHYLALLRRLLKSIDGHAEMESSIILSICAVIDHHHFTNDATTVSGWQEVKSKTKHTAEAAIEAQNAQAFKVQDQMESQVLPMLKRYLFKAVTAKGAHKISSTTSFDDSIVSSKDVVVRVPLALAVVKVLRRLRVSAFYLEFPKLLVSFIKLLKSKQEDVRSSARVTLVKIVDEMGTPYLLPIVEELRHTLQEASTHVLAYTLHTILEKISSIAQPKKPRSLLEQADQAEVDEAFASDLDACLPSMLDIIVEDLFQGVVENQDGSVHKSKTKEAKSTSKSYDALEMLTRSITFLPNAAVHEIVAALITKFQQNPENARSIQVLEESLRRVALGVVKNTGVEKSYVFLYAYNMMEASLESIRPMTELEKAKYKKVTNGVTSWQIGEKTEAAAKQIAKRVDPKLAAKVLLQSKMTGFNRHEIDDVERQQSRTHLDELLSYSAYLLFAFVRSSADKKEAESAALVDPLVPLLMRCASESKNNRAVIHALKCLSVLLNDTKSELPSLDVALSPLVDRIFKILQKAGAATRGNDMVQTCYRTLTIVLRHRPDFRLTEAQLRVVVSFVRADLDETDHQNATYALLKSIIASRLVIPEIYDVVVRIGEILVQSDTQSARANCASIFITFLLEYPLGPKRLTQHLNFLMKNLQYEYESGRRAVLETLTALIKKLPLEVINDKAQLLLLPLVLRLANDESSLCKELATQAIATLVKRMGNQALNECLALIAKWWSNKKDKKLLMTAAQVTSLVLDCRPEFLEKHAVAILSSAYGEVKKRVDELRDDNDSVDESTVIDSWALVLQLLTTIERFSECLIATYETWLLTQGSDFLKTELPALMIEYPHAQVRHAALKIVGSYVSRRDIKTLAFSTSKKIKKASVELVQQSSLYFQSRGALFMWASRVNKVLEKPNVTEATANQVLVVLSWLVAALQAHEATIPQDMNVEDADAISAPAIIPETDEVVEEEAEAQSGDDDSEQEEEDETDEQAIAAQDEKEKQQSKTPLGWVLTRLSYVARGNTSEVVKNTVFKFFAAFIHEQDAEVSQKFVVQLINPLYRSASVLHAKKDESALLMMASSKRYSHAKVDEPPPSALLAQEVLERLEQKIGATAFLDAYTFVQKKLAVFRATRREKRKRDLMNDPQLAAKRKLQKNDQKKRAKQLKKRKFAVLKGTISAVTRPSKVLRPGAE